jgi:hypothetical protein
MAIDRDDLEMVKYIVNNAVYRQQPLDLRDSMAVQAFLLALEEHFERPAENVKSREWRRMVYKKLLDDPEALHQFTMQALEKFGAEHLSAMVAPQLQEKIVARRLEDMSADELYFMLEDSGRLSDFVDYVMEHNPEFVSESLGISHEQLEEEKEAAYDSGYQDGQSEVDTESVYEEGYSQGHEDGRNSVA